MTSLAGLRRVQIIDWREDPTSYLSIIKLVRVVRYSYFVLPEKSTTLTKRVQIADCDILIHIGGTEDE